MFRRPIHVHNSYTRVEQPVHEVTKTVHHHNAPTMESVRLLAEMEEAARCKILADIHLADNLLKTHMVISRCPDGSVQFDVLFQLNGEDFHVEHREHPIRSGIDGRIDALKRLEKKVQDALANAVVLEAMKHMDMATLESM